MVVAQAFHKAEGLLPLGVVPGEGTIAVEHWFVMGLHHPGIEQQDNVLIDHRVGVVAVAELLLEHFPGGKKVIPGFRVRQPGFLPGYVVVVKDRGIDRDRQAVELAFDGGGLQILGLVLA
ncbi:hypothetical protein D3C76_1505540 [compost metagenome]